MYRLYIANRNYSSWSLRPWLLMRTLEVPFEEHLVPFEPHSSWTRFRAFSPTGHVPCLHHKAAIVWDSLAIVEYLAERHAAVWPADPGARAWARSAASEIHSGFPALRSQCSMNCGVRVRLHTIDTALRADLTRLDELWTEGLALHGGPYLAGSEFTAVDAFYAPVAFRLQTYELPVGAAARDYAGRLLGMPEMLNWYREALAEPWREPVHEAEIAAAGVVIQDLRHSAATAAQHVPGGQS